MKLSLTNVHVGAINVCNNDVINGEVVNSYSKEFEGLDGSLEFEISAEELIKQGDQLVSLVEKLMPTIERISDKFVSARIKENNNEIMMQNRNIHNNNKNGGNRKFNNNINDVNIDFKSPSIKIRH